MNIQDPMETNKAETTALKEAVVSALKTDLNEIKSKIIIVLNPKASSEHALQDWDLWGPLILSLLLSIILSIMAPSGQASLLFTGVFAVVAIGSALITANYILLGGKIGFFQSLCAIGYCLFPILCSAIVSCIIPFFVIKLIVVPIGLYGAVLSSSRFFKSQIPESRKFLGLYPSVLLYSILSWMIFVN